MSKLDISTKYSGDTARLTCSGRIFAGLECEELDRTLEKLLREVNNIDLDLQNINFLDSAGIGVLVRTLLRTRIQNKRMRIVALSTPVRKTLEITNLLPQFAYHGQAQTAVRDGLRVMFVHPSAEVRTFVDALLSHRGALIQTCASLYDARRLMTPDRFDVMVVPAELAPAAAPAGITVLELDEDFFSVPAEEAGESLIARLNARVA